MLVVWLLAAMGSAIPINDGPRDEAPDSLPKKNFTYIYRLNCSIRADANAYFCQHHGAYCSTFHVHGSAFCVKDCTCVADASCTQRNCKVEAPAEDSNDSGNYEASTISASTDAMVPTPLAN
jgi:hypothetical protein